MEKINPDEKELEEAMELLAEQLMTPTELYCKYLYKCYVDHRINSRLIDMSGTDTNDIWLATPSGLRIIPYPK